MSTEETYSTRAASGLNPALDLLAQRIGGELILPDHAMYDQARRVLETGIDRRPAAIVRPASAADVVTAVNFARELDLEIAVRSGAHSPAGFGTVDDGIVIDFSLMKAIDFDEESGTVRIEPGCTWSEVAGVLHPYGLAISSGDFGSVGVGGLTTGGGLGWMVRKVGLAADHLVAAEVVLADGSVVHASAEENSDLFWALRGGGGNFGIVVSFQFRPHPAGMVTGGVTIYDAADLAAVVRGATDYALVAPDELTVMINVMHAPPLPFLPPERHGTLIVMVMVCCAGDLERGAEIVAPLRSLATPIADVVGPMPYPAIFSFTDHALPEGAYLSIRSGFLEEIDDALIAAVADQTARFSSPLSLIQLRVFGGELSRKPADSVAFSHRDKPYLIEIVSIWMDPAQSATHHAFTEGFWQEIARHTSGAYVGFLGNEGEERARSAYSEDTHRRLAQVKARYDPTNLFHLNQNIRPVPRS